MDTTTKFTLFTFTVMCLLFNITSSMNMTSSMNTTDHMENDMTTASSNQNGSGTTNMAAGNTSTTTRQTSTGMSATTVTERCYKHSCSNDTMTCNIGSASHIPGRCFRGTGYCYLLEEVDSAVPSVINYTMGCNTTCTSGTTTTGNVTTRLGCCQFNLCNAESSLLEGNGAIRTTVQWILTLFCIVIYVL